MARIATLGSRLTKPSTALAMAARPVAFLPARAIAPFFSSQLVSCSEVHASCTACTSSRCLAGGAGLGGVERQGHRIIVGRRAPAPPGHTAMPERRLASSQSSSVRRTLPNQLLPPRPIDERLSIGQQRQPQQWRQRRQFGRYPTGVHRQQKPVRVVAEQLEQAMRAVAHGAPQRRDKIVIADRLDAVWLFSRTWRRSPSKSRPTSSPTRHPRSWGSDPSASHDRRTDRPARSGASTPFPLSRLPYPSRLSALSSKSNASWTRSSSVACGLANRDSASPISRSIVIVQAAWAAAS
jgi:hypothetical protein